MTLRHVLRHESRLLARDRGLRAVLVLFAALFLYALANGASWVRFQDETLAAVAASAAERSAGLEAELEAIAGGAEPASRFRDPRAANVMGGSRGARTVALEPGPLAALAVGQSDLLPYYYDVSIYTNAQSFLQNGEVENPLNLMVGRFDLAFVLIYLLPLVVLALSYNALSAEREGGTLALTLSQPISARALVGGKLLLRAALVVGLVLAVSVVGGLVVGVTDGGRLALWSGTVVLYALFWFALAAWVNALGRSSAWNATALVAAWLLLVVVVPAAVSIAAAVLHPLPSRVEMVTVQREASNEAVNRRSELLARYLEDHPEMAGSVVPEGANTAALSWAATDEVDRRLEEVARSYEERIAAQRALVVRYRLASPALLAQEALLAVAGTGDARYDDFKAQVRAFAEEWRAYFVPPLLAGTSMGVEELRGAPSFEASPEPLGRTVALAAVPISVLALFLAAAWTGAMWTFRRVRVAG